MSKDLVFISYSSADKPIADAICHHLEEGGVRCWIAPRDIDSTDWAGSIIDGLRRSDVFVVVISHNSISSPEVTKEVTEATRVCRYILPFKVDDEDLSDRLRYHLGPCHWLDAVAPPLESRIEELLQRIRNLSDEDEVYRNYGQRRLVDKIVLPRTLFLGREEEIQEIARCLEEEHVLFLQGMGGIGKSEIAKGYARTFRDQYDTVIFASYTTGLLDLVNGEELPIENLHRNSDGESAEAYFRRKLQVFQSLATPRTLLIVDNFDVDGDPHLEDLANCPCRLLITTRNEHWDYPSLKVGPLADFGQVRKIFAANYGRPIPPRDQDTIDEILRLVDCHTITVELIAKQMRSSFVKPAKMLELLRGTGTNTGLREKVQREGSAGKRAAFDYIRELFHLSGLSEEERHILCCMCMLPYSGIEVSLFGEFLELEDFDVINGLLSKSWLMLDEDTDRLMLHPVIADVVRDQLKPVPAMCQDYVKGLWRSCNQCWYFTVEEREHYAPYVAFLQQNFPEPTPELWREYSDFVNVAWMCGNFELSIASGHRLREMSLREYGPDTEQAGTAATYLAGAYHNSGDNASAEPYYLEGLNYRLAALGPDHMDVGISYGKLGRCAYLRHDFALAREYLEKGIGVFRRLEEAAATPEDKARVRWRSGDTLVEIERMYMEQGDYEKALACCRESYDAFFVLKNEEITNSMYSLVDMGICCSALGRFDEADGYLKRALEINEAMNGKVSLQTARTREAIADNLLHKGDRAQAARLYLELELDLEKLLGPDNPQVVHIRGKREALEAPEAAQ